MIISAGLFQSCHQEPDSLTPSVLKPCVFDCDTSKFDIIWQHPISKDTAQNASMFPLLFNGQKVLFSKTEILEGDDTLKMYDAKTGTKLWEWSDYYVNNRANQLSKIVFKKDGKIFCNSWRQVFCIDENTGKTIWRTRIEDKTLDGHPRMTLIGDYLYHIESKPKDLWNESSTLIRKHINNSSNNWESVFTQKETPDGFAPRIELPIEWIKPNGDTVLLFQCRYIQRQTTQNRIDFIAFNRTKKALEFRLDNIEYPYGVGSLKPHAVYNNNCYFFGINTVYAIDLITQKIIWTKKFPQVENFSYEFPSFLVGDKLLIKPESRFLYLLDPNTGAELSRIGGHGSNSRTFALYNNLIHYSGFDSDGDKIYAFNPTDGKVVWAEGTPNKFRNKFNGNRRFPNAILSDGGVEIDPATGYFYTSDYYFVMCLKLKK